MNDDANNTSKNFSKRDLIILNTPPGQDPLCYWHQVATDAIATADKERERVAQLKTELDKMQSDYKYLTGRLIDLKDQPINTPVDLSNLVRMAGEGKIFLTVSLSISKGDDSNDK